VIESLLVALLCRGHALMIGVPGLGKTLMARTLSRALHMEYRRIQFTPDLMPADITGTDIIMEDRKRAGGGLSFCAGPSSPISCSPMKSIARLPRHRRRSCRRCRTGSHGRAAHLSPDPPFFVVATQNPVEQEGTYPLPEAQLDRFMFNIPVNYPPPGGSRDRQEHDLQCRGDAPADSFC